MTRVRNRFVVWACNFLLNHVATAEYRALVGLSVKRGLEELQREWRR